jgi:hypothetical protein
MYKRSLAVQPDELDTLSNYGTLCSTLGLDDLALSLLERAVAGSPDSISARVNLAAQYDVSSVVPVVVVCTQVCEILERS